MGAHIKNVRYFSFPIVYKPFYYFNNTSTRCLKTSTVLLIVITKLTVIVIVIYRLRHMCFVYAIFGVVGNVWLLHELNNLPKSLWHTSVKVKRKTV